MRTTNQRINPLYLKRKARNPCAFLQRASQDNESSSLAHAKLVVGPEEGSPPKHSSQKAWLETEEGGGERRGGRHGDNDEGRHAGGVRKQQEQQEG